MRSIADTRRLTLARRLAAGKVDHRAQPLERGALGRQPRQSFLEVEETRPSRHARAVTVALFKRQRGIKLQDS